MSVPVSVALRAYPADMRQPRHAHNTTTVSLVVAGAIRERAERSEEVAHSLSVVVKPAGVDHEDEFGPEGATTLQIIVGGDARIAGVDRWRWIHGGSIVPAFVAVLDRLRARRSIESAVFDVLAQLADPPTRVEPRRTLRPQVASRSKWHRGARPDRG